MLDKDIEAYQRRIDDIALTGPRSIRRLKTIVRSECCNVVFC